MTTTIRDLASEMADEMGLERAQVEAAIAAHRTERIEDHEAGSEARDTLARAVWADVTNGAEWPW